MAIRQTSRQAGSRMAIRQTSRQASIRAGDTPDEQAGEHPGGRYARQAIRQADGQAGGRATAVAACL